MNLPNGWAVGIPAVGLWFDPTGIDAIGSCTLTGTITENQNQGGGK